MAPGIGPLATSPLPTTPRYTSSRPAAAPLVPRVEIVAVERRVDTVSEVVSVRIELLLLCWLRRLRVPFEIVPQRPRSARSSSLAQHSGDDSSHRNGGSLLQRKRWIKRALIRFDSEKNIWGTASLLQCAHKVRGKETVDERVGGRVERGQTLDEGGDRDVGLRFRDLLEHLQQIEHDVR